MVHVQGLFLNGLWSIKILEPLIAYLCLEFGTSRSSVRTPLPAEALQEGEHKKEGGRTPASISHTSRSVQEVNRL